MNKLCLGLDTFSVSWHSDLRFPWSPWHVWCKTRSTCKASRTYDGSNMHDHLGKHAPHTYNQPTGCIVDTWW